MEPHNGEDQNLGERLDVRLLRDTRRGVEYGQRRIPPHQRVFDREDIIVLHNQKRTFSLNPPKRKASTEEEEEN